MRAIDVLNYFKSIADWVDWDNTVDRIIIGNYDADIKNVLVTWISDARAINFAINGGFDLLITHEPTFWTHSEEIAALEGWNCSYPKKRTAYNKKKMVEESGLVIMRIHDVWDRMPEIGIPWAWAEFLGLGKKPDLIGGDGFLHRYSIRPISAGEFAREIAKKTAFIGEPFIQLIGDECVKISRVGIGTGAICSVTAFFEMGCDLAVVCDDGCSYWDDVKWAMEEKITLIRVNHSTSEEPGMKTLAAYLNDSFPLLKTEYLPHRSGIKIVDGLSKC